MRAARRSAQRQHREEEVAGTARWVPALAPLSLAGLFAMLAVWSWGRWTDVHIDFGNELYIAWRLAEGDVLYRDIAYRHGPLSCYVNAGLFAAFGVSLRTLVLANLAVLAAITALAHRLLARSAGCVAATAACAFFLIVCGFSQYAAIANFNYVTPYQHAQTHGLLLGLGMVTALDATTRASGLRAAIAAGGCLGALFLTKLELFVPAAGTAVVAGAWLACTGRAGVVRRGVGPLAIAAVAPIAVAFAALCTAMPAADAARGVLGNGSHLGGVWGDPFYRAGAGLTDITVSLARIGWALVVLSMGIAASALFDLPHRLRSLRYVCVVLLGVMAATGSVVPLHRAPDLASALPVTTVGLLVSTVTVAVRRPERRAQLFAPALLAVFALGLLGKMLLFARLEHYGFVLAAPASWLLVAAWVGVLPALLRARTGGGGVARACALVLCAVFAVAFWQRSDRRYAVKDWPVGEGADRILAERPGAARRPALVEQTRAALASRIAPGETLLVLPEGAILNYWLRQKNPSRFWLFLPTELAAFGEAAMLRDLAAYPPDWLVLAHRDPREFGAGPFGRDPRNGRALLAWVREHYERVERFGAEPFTGAGFGTVVLQRRTDAGARPR